MTTEQKPENGRSKKGESSPATAKPTGKRKIKNDDVPEKLPITHNHDNNEPKPKPKSKSKSKSKSLKQEQQQVGASGKDEVVDLHVQVPLVANGNDESKKKNGKSKKEVKEGEDQKKKKMKKMNGDDEEKDDGLLYQIPMSRVSRIIKSEDPNIRITQEAVYIINKASEKFLQLFATEAYASAFLDRKKYIDYKHLSSIVSKRKRFDFLSDFVPEKVKAEDALAESQTVEN